MTRWTGMLVLVLAGLTACHAASTSQNEEPVDAAVAAAPGDGAQPTDFAGRPDTPARDAAALAALASAQDGADPGDPQLLDQERQRRELLAQKTWLLVQEYLANARAFEEQLQFDKAEQELVKARNLDPANPIVLDYLAQIQALQGKPEAEAELLRRTARERYEAQREQMRTLAAADLQAARQAIDEEDFDKAVTLARSVVNRIDWSQGQVAWGPLAGEARDLLAQARELQADQAETVRRRKQQEAFKRLQDEQQHEVAQEEAKVQALLISAAKAFEQADYDQAGELAEAALEIDQHNARAQTILESSHDAAREYADRVFIQKRREQFQRWRLEMEKVRIPNSELFTPPDPEQWKDISERRSSLRSLGLDEVDPEEQALRDQLQEKRLDVDYLDMTLPQVANNIYFSTDIPVSVDPDVAIELDDNAEYVNLTGLKDVTVESLLNILVEQVGEDLAWTVRNGRVYITRKEKAGGEPMLRVHPIQDLTFKLTDFKGTNLSSIALPGESGDDNETTIFNSQLDQVTLIEPDEILNLVRENIATEDWDSSDKYNIDFVDNNNLLVIHTPEVQAQVAKFLDDLREFSTSMVTLESRFYSITDAFIEEIGTDLRGLDPNGPFANEFELTAAGVDGNSTQGLDNLGNGNGNPNAGVFFENNNNVYAAASENYFANPLGDLLSTVGGGAFQFSILNSTQVNLVMNLVSKSENAVEITAPVVSVYNTQRAFVTVVNQVSFVQSFEVDVATAAFIADPVIGVVQEGIVLDVRPTISYDRKYITLDVQTTVAELERPFREVSTLLGPQGTPVTFAIPVLKVQDAQTTVVVPDGGAVVLGGFKHVRYKNRTAEAPWFADIPVLGFFFQEKGLTDEVTDVIVLIRAKITDFSQLRAAGEAHAAATRD